MTYVERCEPAAEALRGALTVAIPTRHSGTREVELRYELIGSGGPVIALAGGISADRHAFATAAFPDAGWWDSVTASFLGRDLRYLGVDWVGADGALDVAIDPADQARAFAAVLDAIGVRRLGAFIGASYGGMVGMHFAADFPKRIGRLVALCAADRPHPYASALRALQRNLIRWGEDNGDAPGGVAHARALAMIAYRSPVEFAQRFAAAPELRGGQLRVASESYLDLQGQRHSERMSAAAYRRLSESIDLHRINPRRIACPVTLVAANSDWLVPASDVHELAVALGGADYHCLNSKYGHDAFLKEAPQLDSILSPILSEIEVAR